MDSLADLAGRLSVDTRRMDLMEERLQKVMSNCGVASRRASEKLILEGRVRVNGVVVRELGTKSILIRTALPSTQDP